MLAVDTDALCGCRQTSGNDVFFRNPFNVEENLFVNISSPSSSKVATRAHFLCAMLTQVPG